MGRIFPNAVIKAYTHDMATTVVHLCSPETTVNVVEEEISTLFDPVITRRSVSVTAGTFIDQDQLTKSHRDRWAQEREQTCQAVRSKSTVRCGACSKVLYSRDTIIPLLLTRKVHKPTRRGGPVGTWDKRLGRR